MGHPETLPSPPPFPAIACLQLSRYDTFRLIGFSAEITSLIRQAASSSWPKGIQRDGEVQDSCWEFKFRGNPWLGQGDEAIPARRLMTAVIHALDTVGWTIYMSCDLSKHAADKDAIFFRHTGIARRRSYCSISFNKTDRVRLIDSPSEVVSRSFGEAVQTWFQGADFPPKHRFSSSISIDDPGCIEYKLGGNPWISSSAMEVIQAGMLCCRLLEAMNRAGYELAASVDMSVGGGGMDVGTWFFASVADNGMPYPPGPSNIASLGYSKN